MRVGYEMINIEKCKDEFLKYTERYDVSDEEIKRKQLHSLRVMQRSKIIAQSLKLSEEEIQVQEHMLHLLKPALQATAVR